MFDVEHILIATPGDPRIREAATRMSRYVCGIESGQECLTEKAYIFETRIPVVFSRYTPDRVASKGHVYLITKDEKNGSRVIMAPGVIGFVMFMQKCPADGNSLKEAQLFFMDYFIRQIEGAYADGNDVLIGGKKTMGISVLHNNIQNTAMIRFMLTLRSEAVNSIVRGGDFAGRKYSGIAGVCDDAGMDEGAARRMVSGFVETALSWRRGNEQQH